MPRRAAPGSRPLVEMELSESDLATLRRVCRLRRIPFSEWQSQPDLVSVFGLTLAALARAERLEVEGYAPTRARDTAALDLGIEPNTLRSHFSRARLHVLKAA